MDLAVQEVNGLAPGIILLKVLLFPRAIRTLAYKKEEKKSYLEEQEYYIIIY